MTVRENDAFLSEMYAVDVSLGLISSVTDVVIAEVDASQSRLLKAMDAVAFAHALRARRLGRLCSEKRGSAPGNDAGDPTTRRETTN